MTKHWRLQRRDYNAACSRRREFRNLLAHHYRSTDLTSHELVFGELVANAVRHGDEPILVDIVLGEDGTVHICVENGGECFDLERQLAASPTPSATGGRGLQIVRALVDSLEVEHWQPHSCRVIATLKVDLVA